MSHLPYIAALWLLVCGVYGIVTSRHLVHLVLCLGVAQSSTYVLLLAIGYRRGAGPPIARAGEPAQASRDVVDPIVQALTVTDIVVGAVVTALLLALAIQAQKTMKTMDPDELRSLRG